MNRMPWSRVWRAATRVTAIIPAALRTVRNRARRVLMQLLDFGYERFIHFCWRQRQRERHCGQRMRLVCEHRPRQRQCHLHTNAS